MDITERKTAEEEIKRYDASLLELNEELRHFAYASSHDLREPLRTIISFIDLIKKNYSDTMDHRFNDYFQFISEGAFRMSCLIDSLLDYSQIQSNKMNFKKVEINEILQIVRNNLKDLIDHSGAEIIYDSMPKINADKYQMVRLFQNLISNSIKFRKNDLSPIIRIKCIVIMEPPDHNLKFRFSIEDNGIGIEPQYTQKIFDIFQRLNNRKQYEGTGIGLAMCKRIVKRHGGTIWVESESNKGSTFYFTIPDNKSESK